MGDAKDELDRTGPMPRARASVTRQALPVAEPNAGAADQVASLQASLRELEATFRYMGKGHPQFEATQARLIQLREMLARAERG